MRTLKHPGTIRKKPNTERMYGIGGRDTLERAEAVEDAEAKD